MTLYLNLHAGPGAGKSTLCAGLFYRLKVLGITCEMVTEFAKDLTWAGHKNILSNPLLVTGEQWQRLRRLEGKVDIVITDSPLLLAIPYLPEEHRGLSDDFIAIHKSMERIDVFVERTKDYCPKGRWQSEVEALGIDTEVMELLENVNGKGNFLTTTGDPQGLEFLMGVLGRHVGRG